MLDLIMTGQFKRDLKRIQKRSLELELLKNVIRLLLEEQTLDEKYRDHALTGSYRGFRECHIQPDWLLIYRVRDGVLYLERTGSHSDLFL